MGVRQRIYWLRQADAVKRQLVADIGYGVRMGMSDPSEYEKAVDELELTRTAEEARAARVENTWAMLYAIGGGKGV